MIKLVLLRHGQSIWNKENRFTGWTDVPLTEQGKSEAKKSAKKYSDIISLGYVKKVFNGSTARYALKINGSSPVCRLKLYSVSLPSQALGTVEKTLKLFLS